MRYMRILLVIFVLCWSLAAQTSHDHPAPEKLGTVLFPISCQPGVQKEFVRGVALLHSFAYSASRSAFLNVAEKDSNCAIAHWGVAMTYFHQLWEPSITPEDLLLGQQEIRRAQQMGTGSGRERGFIHALASFYGQGQDAAAVPYETRASNYAVAMKRLAAAHRDDVESQVFYALALLATASPLDKTHARQKLAAQILGSAYRQYPQHPGIAHYLIHACDNQEMARRGLTAAQAYSLIAPSAPHALHMPSHIFTRLGMWPDSIHSNRAARAAAQEQGDTGEELHAMDYLVYAYLQEGRDAEASEIIQQLQSMSNLNKSDFKVTYASTAMPIRYAMERRQWVDAAHIASPPGAPPHVVAIAVWARALGFARSGDPAQARIEIKNLHQLEQQLRLSKSANSQYWAAQVAIQALEASAWSAQTEGNTKMALELLRKAASEEDAVEKLPVTPGPIILAREQLGDLLLEQDKPRQALREFQTSLSNAPGRRGALTGASRAKAQLASVTPHP